MVGPKVLVDQVTRMVDDLISEAGNAETLVDAVVAAQQAQEQALTVTMESVYKPMSVTAIIHGNKSVNDPSNISDSNKLLALPADRLAAALLHGTESSITENIEVPNLVVGTIIGRGGETIASIQAQTNCKLQIQKEQDIVPGQSNRIITLSANSQLSIDQCKQIIFSLVQERMNKLNPTQNQQQSSLSNNVIILHDGSTVPSHYTMVEVDVPDADVGLIIGKMGGTFHKRL